MSFVRQEYEREFADLPEDVREDPATRKNHLAFAVDWYKERLGLALESRREEGRLSGTIAKAVKPFINMVRRSVVHPTALLTESRVLSTIEYAVAQPDRLSDFRILHRRQGRRWRDVGGEPAIRRHPRAIPHFDQRPVE